MRGRDLRPGGGESAKLGNQLKTGGGVITGVGRVTGGDRINAPGLVTTVAPGTGRDDVSGLATIGAEVAVSAAATLFLGKGATIAGAHAVQIHGDVGLGGGGDGGPGRVALEACRGGGEADFGADP